MMQLVGLRGRIWHSMALSFISISPFVSCFYNHDIQSRQIADCTDATATTSPSCWNVLGIPAWLSQFAGPNSTCATSHLASLAGANLSWDACFILTLDNDTQGQIVADGLGRMDVNTTSTGLYQEALEVMSLEDRQRYLYVLGALSDLSNFFVDWNDTLASKFSASNSNTSAIMATLDPNEQASFAGDELYQALLLGLPFFLAYNGTGIPLGLSLEDISGLLLELVQIADVPLANLSTPTNFTGVIEASALLSALTQFATTLGTRVQYGLQSITDNLDTFRNTTANGAFASPQSWSIPQDPASFAQPFNTFLVSSILAQNNWTVFALVGIDVAALSQTSGGTLPAWVLSNCLTCTPPVNFGCSSYDTKSQCGRWWYSEDLNSSFTLVQRSNSSNDPTDLISTIFQQGWTTGDLLLENSALCDEPPSLVHTLSMIPQLERPASPTTDYMDSWFWRLLGVAPLEDTASVDIVVSDNFSAYIESRPALINHPRNTISNISGGKIDFACMSQLDVQVGWNFSGIVAGDYS